MNRYLESSAAAKLLLGEAESAVLAAHLDAAVVAGDQVVSCVLLETGLRRLEEGKLFGIYPEGTRSPDGRLYRGKTGVARLALESGAPVIPVAMIDTDKAQPIGQRLPRPMRIGIVIGEPLDFSRYKGMENDRFILRSVTDEIMYALMSLSGQEYVDVYAATQKARIAAGNAEQSVPGAVSPRAPGGRPVPEVHVPVPPEDVDEPSVE